MVDQRLAQPLGALRQERVAVSGLEEPLPPLRPGVQMVQSVGDVGQHAVDVEDGERAGIGVLGGGGGHCDSVIGLITSAMNSSPLHAMNTSATP